MIKSVHIKNIQSHINTKLEFCDGVNMIIGDSDSGKSAILNSINWCKDNRPLGDPHRNWNGGEMVCSVEFDNGTAQISRDKQTKYKVIRGKKNTKAKSFKASGQTPPEEVTQLFNMNKKINTQKQLERGAPIFLISESPGDVASFFNKVAGLYKIDDTIINGKTDLRKTQINLNTTKEQIKEKQQELVKYAGIDKIYTKVLVCDETAKKQAKKALILGKVESTLVSITKIENTIDLLQQKVQIKQKVNIVLNLIKVLNSKKETIKEIAKVLEQIKLKEQKQKKNKMVLKIKEKVQKGITLIKINEKRAKEVQLHLEIINKINDYQNVNESFLIDNEARKMEFDELMPNQCPLCGGKYERIHKHE